MRKFPYITTGKILEDLRKEGLTITRVTFYKLEKEGLFITRKTSGNWRVFSVYEAEAIKKAIRINYGLIEDNTDSLSI